MVEFKDVIRGIHRQQVIAGEIQFSEDTSDEFENFCRSIISRNIVKGEVTSRNVKTATVVIDGKENFTASVEKLFISVPKEGF